MKAGTQFIILSSVLLPLVLFCGCVPQKGPAVSAYHEAEMEFTILKAINAVRAKEGFCRLEKNPDLDRIAWKHTSDMIRMQRISHRGSDRLTISGRADQMGVNWQVIGENVARNQGYKKPAIKAVLDWLGSKGHSKNIYNPNFTKTGIGVARSRDGYIYLTQVFMLPRPE